MKSHHGRCSRCGKQLRRLHEPFRVLYCGDCHMDSMVWQNTIKTEDTEEWVIVPKK